MPELKEQWLRVTELFTDAVADLLGEENIIDTLVGLWIGSIYA